MLYTVIYVCMFKKCPPSPFQVPAALSPALLRESMRGGMRPPGELWSKRAKNRTNPNASNWMVMFFCFSHPHHSSSESFLSSLNSLKQWKPNGWIFLWLDERTNGACGSVRILHQVHPHHTRCQTPKRMETVSLNSAFILQKG